MKKGNSNSALYTLLIKVAILCMLAFALYKQLFDNNQLHEVTERLRIHVHENGFLLIIFSFLLMILNWSLEAWKWKLLMQKISPVKFARAFKAVWTGVTLGLFTPNRVGEYGGRILYLPRKFRIKGIVGSLLGSYAQLLANVSAGLIALIFFIRNNEHVLNFTFITITVLVTVAIIVLSVAYFNLDILVRVFQKWKFFRRIQPYMEVLNYYSSKQYLSFLLLSLLRYGIYTAQYLIFLRLFNVSLQVGDGITVVGVIFLTQTILPTFAFAELVVRGSIAATFLHNYTENDFAAVGASTCMWLLNLIIPAVLGYIFIMRYNFFKNNNSK